MRRTLPSVAPERKHDLREEATSFLPFGEVRRLRTAPVVVGPGDRLAGAGATVVMQWVLEDGIGRDLTNHIILSYIRAIHPQVLEMREGELRLVIPEQDARQILSLQHYMINLVKNTQNLSRISWGYLSQKKFIVNAIIVQLAIYI